MEFGFVSLPALITHKVFTEQNLGSIHVVFLKMRVAQVAHVNQ